MKTGKVMEDGREGRVFWLLEFDIHSNLRTDEIHNMIRLARCREIFQTGSEKWPFPHLSELGTCVVKFFTVNNEHF